MSRRGKRAVEKEKSKIFSKIIVVAIFLGLVFFVLKVAPNYVNTEIVDKTNLVINNTNVTDSLKSDVIIENGVIYISEDDIQNFFDPHIYYDEKYNLVVTTSANQMASIVVGENAMTDNGNKESISGTVIERNNTRYIPFSSLKNVYNVEINYINSSDTVTVDSLDEKYVTANSTKDNVIKADPTYFSRTVDTLTAGEKVTVVQDDNNENNQVEDWVEVRTDAGKLGYIKYEDLSNETVTRQKKEESKPIDGKVSLVWDFFTELAYPPDRTGTKIQGVNVVSPSFFNLVDEGKGKLNQNVGDEGKKYIEWAHSNGYKVWPIVSNNGYKKTTSEILNDYYLRQDLINNILNYVKEYNLDGINIDFEYMYETDKDMFSRFIIELAPRLREIGVAISVDVTAPDGSPEWSLCFDRTVIGEVADYIIFMGYDQYGAQSNTEGTNAGYDWVETNIKKFLGQEAVDSDKLVLAVPFYVRVWKEKGGEVTNVAVNMNKLDEIVPDNAKKIWVDSLKQYYIEYEKDGTIYKIWSEDEESIKAKLSLVTQYNLAGAAYWEKDMETDSIWGVISQALGVE